MKSKVKLPNHTKEILGRMQQIRNAVETEQSKQLSVYGTPPVLEKITSTFNTSKEWRSYGRVAEWLYVHEGKLLPDIAHSDTVPVAEDILKEWKLAYSWDEKRKRYLKRGDTVTGMVYDLLYTKLLDVTQEQVNGRDISSAAISDLEKLVKMFKNTGIPFQDQVITVMKVFLRFIENKTDRGSKDQLKYIEFVKSFVTDVENGIIRMEE